MSEPSTIHAFINCWPGKEAGAHHTAKSLVEHVDHLTVLYKNDTGKDESGAGEWLRIPSERYLGWQFQECLRLAQGDIILQIQADASCEDWPNLVRRCRHAFAAHEKVAVWTPNVDWSDFPPHLISSMQLEGEDLVTAVLIDGIVWAFNSDVADWMRQLDYSGNNLGWGLTEVASALAVTRGRLVTMDTAVKVHHPKGSSYQWQKALDQSTVFTNQLSEVEMSYIRTGQHLIHYRREDLRMRPLYTKAQVLTPTFWRQTLRGLVSRQGRRDEPMPSGIGR